MRYRPFAADGLSCSAVTIALQPGATPAGAFELVCAALEDGVNSFSVAAGDQSGLEALRRAVASVGRRLLILILRVDLEGEDVGAQARSALRAAGATSFDAVMPDGPIVEALSPDRFLALETLRRDGIAARVGLAAEASAAAAVLGAFPIDILALRYTMTCGWTERNVLKAAAERGITVFGYNHYVGSAAREPEVLRGFSRLFRRPSPAAAADAYAFLHETPDWTARQVSLAYVLGEPAVASVIVEALESRIVHELSRAVERELPAGVAAQIEMARFAKRGERAA